MQIKLSSSHRQSFILISKREGMDGSKKEKKDADNTSVIDDPDEDQDSSLDGKKLHDLYRHITKLIK